MNTSNVFASILMLSALVWATSSQAQATDGPACPPGQSPGAAATIDLYMESDTKRIVAEPGPGRVRLGRFRSVNECPDAVSSESHEPAGTEVEESQQAAVPATQSVFPLVGDDGDFSVRLGGRLHADFGYQDEDSLRNAQGDRVDAVNGTQIRRARILLDGGFLDNFYYKFEVDFADNATRLTDVFLVYTGIDNFELTVGNQKQAVSMELQESSNDIMFTERSLISALTATLFDRAIGINAKGFGNDWSAQAGLYGDSARPNDRTQRADEGIGFAARATYAPINTREHVLHLGAYGGWRQPNDMNQINDRSPSFSYDVTSLDNLTLVNTGMIDDIENTWMGGAELAGMVGPVSMQSEYTFVDVEREGGQPDLSFQSAYVQFGWTLTGESRRYKGSDGEFKYLVPSQPFNFHEGTWGAWEVATRFDYLDLDSEDIQGGQETRATLALNWYLNRYFRMMADYSRSLNVDGSPITTSSGGEPDDVNAVTIRAQWAF